MKADTFISILSSVSETVLAAIRDMDEKQRIKRPICLDSVALVLKVKLSDLVPIIKHLESEGQITIYPNRKQRLRVIKLDSISLN